MESDKKDSKDIWKTKLWSILNFWKSNKEVFVLPSIKLYWKLQQYKRGEWKSWLKIQHLKKKKIMATSPITSWQTNGEIMQTGEDYFLGLQKKKKSLQMVTAAMKLKDAYILEEKLWQT